MRKKRALITGITGQDGSYLTELLVGKGYDVYGFVRRTSSDPFTRLKSLRESHAFKVLYGNMRDVCTIERAIEDAKPDEIYNLAAQSHVGLSFGGEDEVREVNWLGVGRLLDAVSRLAPKARVYQASTSEMFGATPPPQNERSPFHPVSPYAEAKLRAHEDFVVGYRERRNFFVCSGILFNHESPRRGENFVTRKTTISLAKVKLGLQDHLELGNLDVERDWGFAGDYVEAMWLMLQQSKPQDFVIATGEAHTVRELVTEAAQVLGMDISWHGKGAREVGKDRKGKVIVRVNPEFYRPRETNNFLGDASKARRVLGWKPKVGFKELVHMMAEHDFKVLSSGR